VTITDDSGQCNHDFQEEYYGYRCVKCQQFIPYGCEPWAADEDEEMDESNPTNIFYEDLEDEWNG
jgi:hypothetical protein